jgi:hypothetical protein
VREYAGAQSQQATLALLQELRAKYLEELELASLDRVPTLQANLRQLGALAAVVRGDVHATGLAV